MSNNLIQNIVPKVSVIIPVYNTAQFLKSCFDSIINQTLSNIQIIIVNDGSTDGSIDIINEYMLKDERIEVINQNNKGLSEARNSGYKIARGKYIYFMDSDDVLDIDCLELCNNLAEKKSLDFVCFDAENIDDKFHYLQNYDRSHCIKESLLYKGIELLNIQIENYCYKSPVWLNFIRKESLDKWFVGFCSGIIHEDHIFTVELFLKSERCQYIKIKFLKKRNRNGSITTSKFSRKNIDGYKVTVQRLTTLSKENAIYRTIINELLNQMLNSVVWQSHVLSLLEKIKLIIWLIKVGKFKTINVRNYIVCFMK